MRIYVHAPDDFILNPGESKYIKFTSPRIRKYKMSEKTIVIETSPQLLEHHVVAIGGEEGVLLINHGIHPRRIEMGEVICIVKVVRLYKERKRKKKEGE